MTVCLFYIGIHFSTHIPAFAGRTEVKHEMYETV